MDPTYLDLICRQLVCEAAEDAQTSGQPFQHALGSRLDHARQPGAELWQYETRDIREAIDNAVSHLTREINRDWGSGLKL